MNAQQEKIEIEQKVVMTPSLARDFGISPIPEEWYAKKPGSKVNLSIRNTNDRSFNKWFIDKKQIAVLVEYIKKFFECGTTHFETIYDEIVKIEIDENKTILPIDGNNEPITSYRFKKYVSEVRNGIHGDVIVASRYAGTRNEIKRLWLSGISDKQVIATRLEITPRRVHKCLIGFGLIEKKVKGIEK